MRHVNLSKESIPAIPFWNSEASTPYQKLEVPESGSTLHQLCSMVCPSLRCSCRKRPVSCREAEGLVTELWPPRIVTIYCILIVLLYDCCKLSFQPPWVGSVAASLSAADVPKMWGTAEKRFMRHVNLSKGSIPAKFPVLFFAKTFNSWRDQRVTIQLEHRQGRCLSCESVMDSNDFSP